MTSEETTKADCTVAPTTSPTPTPISANPLASMLGVSDQVLYLIVGFVSATLIAAVAIGVVIRNRRRKQRKLKKQTERQSMNYATLNRQMQLGFPSTESMAPFMPSDLNRMTPNESAARLNLFRATSMGSMAAPRPMSMSMPNVMSPTMPNAPSMPSPSFMMQPNPTLLQGIMMQSNPMSSAIMQSNPMMQPNPSFAGGMMGNGPFYM